MSSVSLGSLLNSSSFNSAVNSLLSNENTQLSRVKSSRSSLNSTRTTFTRLDSLVSTLKTEADSLALPATSSSNIFKKTGATSSDAAKVVVKSSTSSATPGTHVINTYQLAQAFTRSSSSATSTANTLGLGAGGTLRITLKTNTASPTNVDVPIDLTGLTTNKDILDRIAQSINSKIASSVSSSTDQVTATVLTESSTNVRLTLTSNTTGQTYEFGLTDVSGSISTIFQAASKSGAQLNAILSVDGTVIFRDKNEISDAITGVTFELKDSNLSTADKATFSGTPPTSGSVPSDIVPVPTTDTTPVQIAVGWDLTSIRASVQKFIDAYNNLVSFINSQTQIDATDPTNVIRSTLSGNATYLNLKRRLGQMIFSQVTSLKSYTDAGQLTGGLTGDPVRLQDIGISLGNDGKLSISNTSTFDSKLQNNQSGVIHLFTFDGKRSDGTAASPARPIGITVQFRDLMDGYSKTGGVIDQSKKGIDLRIKNIDSRISLLTRVISRKQVQIADQLTRLQEAIISSDAQRSFLQSLLLFGFFQSGSGITSR